jgi:hypothetical protein
MKEIIQKRIYMTRSYEKPKQLENITNFANRKMVKVAHNLVIPILIK